MNPTHLTDQDLLLHIDDERHSERALRHLLTCPDCRNRMNQLKTSIGELERVSRAEADRRIPPPDAARRALAARLAQLRSEEPPNYARSLLRFDSPAKRATFALALAVAACLVVSIPLRSREKLTPPRNASLIRDSSLPDPYLTPGSFRPLQREQVCGTGSYQQARVDSPELRQAVLREYGMPGTAATDHEIDFLVIPELGGTEDLQNLWPEPYDSTVWNARVKDHLEEHLHTLVCEQKIDLATAQRDIATDWIAAYKKYFHTESPQP
jgi:hypothetical protein